RRHDGRRDWLAPVLCVEDRTAEVAGQRRAERRPRIVARQAGETVRRGTVLGRIEFLAARSCVAGLERVDQRAAGAEQGDGSDAGQLLAGQAGDGRRFRAQPHGRGGIGDEVVCHDGVSPVALAGCAAAACVGVVRTILTSCWRLPLPRRSSAAPNSRSTIRTFWWTRLLTICGSPADPSTKIGGISPCTIPAGEPT